MDFQSKVVELAKRIENLRDSVQTEEATKHSFVMPFICTLSLKFSILFANSTTLFWKSILISLFAIYNNIIYKIA